MAYKDYQLNVEIASRSCRRAFTLIELLTVIFIITLLIGLLLAALSGVREQATVSKNMVNLRTCSIAITRYADEHGGLVPVPEARKHPINAIPYEPYDLEWSQLRYLWPSPMPETDDPAFREALVSPWFENMVTEEELAPPDGSQRIIGTSYWMGSGYIRSDVVFSQTPPFNAWDDPTMLQIRKLYEVAFPSQKGLLISRWSAFGTPNVGDPDHQITSLTKPNARNTAFDAAFADGSVASLYPRDSVKPWEVDEPEDRFFIPVLNTPLGLQGVDR